MTLSDSNKEKNDLQINWMVTGSSLKSKWRTKIKLNEREQIVTSASKGDQQTVSPSDTEIKETVK